MCRLSSTISAIVLAIAFSDARAAEERAAPPRGVVPRKSQIESWLARSQAHAAKMSDAQRSDAAVGLCSAYVTLGRMDVVTHLASKMEDEQERVNALIGIAAALAESQGVEAAVRFAESLGKARRVDSSGRVVYSPRNRALFMTALSQFRIHDFTDAGQTIRRIDDPQYASVAWCRLAEAQGRAGRYDEGLKSLENVTAAESDRKREARKAIEECRIEGRKDVPLTSQTRYIDGLRAVLGLFGDVTLGPGTLDQQEARIDKLRDAADRTSAWRQFAWRSYRAGDRPRCLRAIGKCLETGERIPGKMADLKALNNVLVADLYLELGQKKEAEETVRKTASTPPTRNIFENLGAFTTAPLVVSVYVRTGHIAEAIEVAEEIKEQNEIAWTSLGVFSALEGELKPIEQLLQTTADERIKAIVCAGVAQGLQEKRMAKTEGTSDAPKPQGTPKP
jgi:hypothetical protein